MPFYVISTEEVTYRYRVFEAANEAEAYRKYNEDAPGLYTNETGGNSSEDREDDAPEPPYKCPNCGASDQIDIAATVWVRLIQSEDGSEIETDADQAEDKSHDWSEHSGVICRACGFGGNVDQFENPAAKEEPTND